MSSPRCAVFVAHPGHELRIHHWIELNRPVVLVLTDGSGRTQTSRIPSTQRVLAATGSTPGPLFGRYTDRQIHDRLLACDTGFFVDLANEVAGFLASADIELLAGDAEEGFNASHDVCRYMIDSAVEQARRKTGRKIAVHQFALVGRPDACPEELVRQAIWVRLDDEALKRKLDTARGYPEESGDVERALAQFGVAPFRVECLQPVTQRCARAHPEEKKPFYETYGERQRDAGLYPEVIRLEAHVEPVRRALAQWAGLPV